MIKKNILFLFAGLVLVLDLSAQQQNPQLAFNNANEQLQEGNIPAALAQYNRLEASHNISGALFLNMGLAYTQVDSMGKAKFYFLKAEQFEETEPKAREGLAYVETRFSHQSAVLPVLPWERALNWLTNKAGPTLLLAVGVILFNLGILLYIATWFRERSGKTMPRTGLATAGIGSLIILLSFYTDYRAQRYSTAVMVTRQADVTEQPGPEAAIVNQAYEGYTFSVDHTKSKDQSNWSYIRMSNGQYGWIPTEEIMIL